MRRFAIRLAIGLALLLIVSQFAIPPYLEGRVSDRLTAHGGSADVELSAFPSLGLLFGSGRELRIAASRLSVDLERDQGEVFKRLDDFSDVSIEITDSRAGPFTIRGFRIRRIATHEYAVAVAGDGTAGDVARYAGSRLAGGFGRALAGLAASALGDFDRPIPFDAQMQIVTDSAGIPRSRGVSGAIDGLPAGPLVQVVTNALLRGV